MRKSHCLFTIVDANSCRRIAGNVGVRTLLASGIVGSVKSTPSAIAKLDAMRADVVHIQSQLELFCNELRGGPPQPLAPDDSGPDRNGSPTGDSLLRLKQLIANSPKH